MRRTDHSRDAGSVLPAKDDAPSAGVALGIFSLILAGGAWWQIMTLPEQSMGTSVLVYDELALPRQVEPYVTAGYDRNEVVKTAFDAAIKQGYVILRRSNNVSGGDKVLFDVRNFIDVPRPSSDGRQRSGTGNELSEGLGPDNQPLPEPQVIGTD